VPVLDMKTILTALASTDHYQIGFAVKTRNLSSFPEMTISLSWADCFSVKTAAGPGAGYEATSSL
jgi:hypothetical protein